MRFTINHSQLTPALSVLARIVPSRSVRPILSSILIQARDGHLTLAATDLETAVVTTVPALVNEEGRAAIPSRYLSDLVKRIPAGNLTWASDSTASGISVTWEHSEFSLHGYDPEEYPPIPHFPPQADRVLPQRVLRHAFAHTVFAAAQGESARALLTGVEVLFSGENLFALATDGFQVAAYATDPSITRPRDSAIVIPASVLQELSRTLNETDDPCDIAQQGNQILFRAGSTHLVSRLLEGKYFAVLDLIPKDFPTVTHIARDMLFSACERVSLVSDAEPPHPITMTVEGDHLELSAHSPEVGSAKENIGCRTMGPSIRIGFNGRQLIEGLRRFAGLELKIDLSGPTTLARFVDPADGRLQFMQMPLQMPV